MGDFTLFEALTGGASDRLDESETEVQSVILVREELHASQFDENLETSFTRKDY